MANKALTLNFLNNELKKKAQAKGLQVIPQQASVNMADVAKIKVTNEKVKTTSRPQ